MVNRRKPSFKKVEVLKACFLQEGWYVQVLISSLEAQATRMTAKSDASRKDVSSIEFVAPVSGVDLDDDVSKTDN